MEGLTETVQREFIYIGYYVTVQWSQLFRYWVLGVVLGSAVSVFGKRRIHSWVVRMRDAPLGAWGLIPASLLGIASPLCLYGTVPVAASFSEKGVGDDWLAAFMMSSLLLNPQLLIYSAALGQRVLLVRLLSCFLCGLAAGWCVRLFARGGGFFRFSGLSGGADRDTDPNLLLRFLKNVWRNVRVTGPYFLAGIVLSALFQRYVPESAVARLFGGFAGVGGNKGFGILMAAALGVPLYACGGGTIPLLLDWMQRGMSLGSATAFMIMGPATKITTLGALKIVLGARDFFHYLIFCVLFAFLSGLAAELLV